MRDLRDAAPRAFVGGQWATFTGFEHHKADEECIDFVFGRSGDGWWVHTALCFVRERSSMAVMLTIMW